MRFRYRFYEETKVGVKDFVISKLALYSGANTRIEAAEAKTKSFTSREREIISTNTIKPVIEIILQL
ncbi:hypothetical protein [Brevibacillus laterosporus]|uniref:Uncharacterized protein n=1 Tax=Brevibacillus laterosporus TaxID=1465 RepID=A0AAP8QB85_BRELA|nr:hypothetical protein [Brevibacillus laterosporus]MBG9772627.1 hypothetical protein [Brevibacillus laterosporus]MBG9798108.1 hypothetical protein [Brevibacillus laterosporus]MCZ0845733.1 hypothetical protein [Brevibacillus laterosporus]MED1913446.1 hypothetical protein [Brevibacillus laterosporus]PPA84122.1 hypothetical protein C4A75_13660 [Brevibacillus laterosporus]